MLRSIRLFAALSIIGFAPFAHAETIAVVNIPRIMHDSLAAKSAKDQLSAKQQQFQDQIKAKEADLKKEEGELQKQQSTLAPEAFQQKVATFRQKAASVQADARVKQAQLSKAFELALVQLQKSIVDIISGMAKEKGFSVALPSTQTLYYNPSLDVTDEVLSRLNKKLTKITLNFQPASSGGSGTLGK